MSVALRLAFVLCLLSLAAAKDIDSPLHGDRKDLDTQRRHSNPEGYYDKQKVAQKGFEKQLVRNEGKSHLSNAGAPPRPKNPPPSEIPPTHPKNPSPQDVQQRVPEQPKQKNEPTEKEKKAIAQVYHVLAEIMKSEDAFRVFVQHGCDLKNDKDVREVLSAPVKCQLKQAEKQLKQTNKSSKSSKSKSKQSSDKDTKGSKSSKTTSGVVDDPLALAECPETLTERLLSIHCMLIEDGETLGLMKHMKETIGEMQPTPEYESGIKNEAKRIGEHLVAHMQHLLQTYIKNCELTYPIGANSQTEPWLKVTRAVERFNQHKFGKKSGELCKYRLPSLAVVFPQRFPRYAALYLEIIKEYNTGPETQIKKSDETFAGRGALAHTIRDPTHFQSMLENYNKMLQLLQEGNNALPVNKPVIEDQCIIEKEQQQNPKKEQQKPKKEQQPKDPNGNVNEQLKKEQQKLKHKKEQKPTDENDAANDDDDEGDDDIEDDEDEDNSDL